MLIWPEKFRVRTLGFVDIEKRFMNSVTTDQEKAFTYFGENLWFLTFFFVENISMFLNKITVLTIQHKNKN